MGFGWCDAAHLFELVFGGGEADFEAVDLAVEVLVGERGRITGQGAEFIRTAVATRRRATARRLDARCVTHDVHGILVPDVAALLVAEYLALRHDGAPERAIAEFGLATHIVREWFPVRALAMSVALDATGDDSDVDALASLALAHSLQLPLVTKNADLTSATVTVLRC